MKTLKRAEELFVTLNSMVVGVLFFTMFLLVFGNVITRYVFNFSLNWSEELSRYLMVWMAYLGAGLALRAGSHVAIEIFQDLVPKPVRRAVRAFVGLVMLVFMGFLFVLGCQYVQFGMTQRTPALQWPTGWIYIAIPAGALAFMLHLLTMFRSYIEKPPTAEEAGLADAPERAGGLGA